MTMSSIAAFAGLAALISAALLQTTSAQKRYPFPPNCTCGYTKLEDSCSAIAEPTTYPRYEALFGQECLPPVPVNHRLCYRTKVQKCRDIEDRPYHGCRLFVGGPRLGFKLAPLDATGGNESSVFIDSLDETASRTVCFYNISVSRDSTYNCSELRLKHKENHPQNQYVDPGNQSYSNSSLAECNSYVRVEYDSEGGRQHYTLCREELATFDSVLPNTSLLVIYWTGNTDSNSSSSSFHLQAECVA